MNFSDGLRLHSLYPRASLIYRTNVFLGRRRKSIVPELAVSVADCEDTYAINFKDHDRYQYWLGYRHVDDQECLTWARSGPTKCSSEMSLHTWETSGLVDSSNIGRLCFFTLRYETLTHPTSTYPIIVPCGFAENVGIDIANIG